jgi:hypothetical protein
MTTSAVDPIARLRRIASLLPADCAADAAWLTGAIDAAVAGASLEEALGLYPGWRAAHRMREQEALVRELVARFGPMSSGEIAERIDRFARGSREWSPGSISELLFYVVRAGALPSARTVRRVLAANRSGHSVHSDGHPVALSPAP